MNFPNETQHLAVIGQNGTGKTYAAAWHLSGRPFDRKPYVIVDTKRDELLGKIADMEGVKHITLADTPSKPGLYIVQPLPDQIEGLHNFLMRIWARGNCGLYFDEGYMVASVPAVDTILTTGRSKRIPVIMLSQRPVWLSRFVFSESKFYQVFFLADERDRKTVQAFVPGYDLGTTLPPYCSVWYEVGQDRVTLLRPTPPRSTILQTFHQRLHRKVTLV